MIVFDIFFYLCYFVNIVYRLILSAFVTCMKIYYKLHSPIISFFIDIFFMDKIFCDLRYEKIGNVQILFYFLPDRLLVY